MARPSSARASGRSAPGILLASELRRRWRVHLGLAGVFAFTAAALVVTLGAVQGVVAAVGVEVQETLAGDWRVGHGDVGEVGDGAVFNASHGLADRLEIQVAREMGLPRAAVRATPRLETEALFSRDTEVQRLVAEDVEAGLLVGVDPARDPKVLDVPERLVEGRFLQPDSALWVNGTPYAEIVVGVDLLENLNLSVYHDGTLEDEHLLSLTAGRVRGGSSNPVRVTAVVVGVMETGYQFLDRRIAFAHLDTAREALGVQQDDDAASVVVLTTPPGAPLPQLAAAAGLTAVSSRAFMHDHLGAFLDPVDAFTRVVGVVVLALSGGWVAHVASAAVLADRQRIAVLRALGLPASLVLGPVAAAVVLAGLAGALAGVAAGWALARVADVVRLYPPGVGDFRVLIDLTPALAGTVVAAVLATSGLAALVTGLALRRIPVTDALKGRG